MKKNLRKSIFREIKSTFSRFIAIFAISALGAGFFAGLRATAPNMRATAEDYYAQQQLMDFRLLSTMGFTEDDITALRSLDSVDVVMPSYGLDLLTISEETSTDEGFSSKGYVGKIKSSSVSAAHFFALPQNTEADNPEYLNQIVLQEGRLPQNAAECVVDAASSYSVGDSITLSDQNNPNTMDLMAVHTFTVVGRADSPYYIAFQRGNTNIGSGTISFFVVTTPAAFNSDYYTEVFLTMKGTQNISPFSDEYKTLQTSADNALTAKGEEQAQLRYQDLYTEGAKKLEEARAELAKAEAEADEKLSDAKKAIETGEAEIAKAKKEITDNEKKLTDAQQEVTTGAAQVADARATLQQGQAEYDAGLATYNTSKQQYDTAKASLDTLETSVNNLAAIIDALNTATANGTVEPTDIPAFIANAQNAIGILQGLAQLAQTAPDPSAVALAAQLSSIASNATVALQSGAPYLNTYNALNIPLLAASYPVFLSIVSAARTQLNAAGAELEQAWAKLAAAKTTLDGGWGQLASAEASLAEAQALINTGRTELESGKQKLATAEKELDEGRAEYNAKKAEADEKLADARAEIEDGQKQLDELEPPDWYIFDRESNPGYSGFDSDATRINAIAQVIPLFFFLVAILVCLTTMTRMVEDHRTQIGTLKALGFGKFSIAFKYLFYAGFASATGALAGVFVGLSVFPSSIWHAYQIMYIMPNMHFYAQPALSLLSVLSMVLCTTLAALAACFSSLAVAPANLMRPKAPKPGKRVLLERIPFVWKHLGFSKKVTVRNLFRDKKRFIMTVIGVAGCSALLLTGFGLKDSISGIAGLQFGNIYQYNAGIALQHPGSAEDDNELNTTLSQYGEFLYKQEISVDASSAEGNNNGMTTYLLISEQPENTNKFINFHQRQDGSPIAFPQGDAVIITEKLASRLKVEVGDTIQVARGSEKSVALTVGGIMENYIVNFIYITPQTYTSLFGSQPAYNTILLNMNETGQANPSAALEKIISTDGVAGAVDISSMESQVNDMLQSMNSVVWLIILSAALLAFVVLYNLTNINITERAREIATLKVLGFYDKEVSSYVYRENILLTLAGIAVGLVGGVILHRFVITTVEIDEVMFRRSIEVASYFWSILFTLLSSLFVNIVMLGRLKKIDMVESLKSAE